MLGGTVACGRMSDGLVKEKLLDMAKAVEP